MSTINNRLMGAAGTLAIALGALAAVPGTAGADEPADEQTAKMIAAGKKISFDRKKGNCLACHHIDGGEAPGSIGPPLIAMSVRYTEKAKLRAQIWDSTIANPESPMPPFGSHHILTDKEIDQVVEFIWTK